MRIIEFVCRFLLLTSGSCVDLHTKNYYVAVGVILGMYMANNKKIECYEITR